MYSVHGNVMLLLFQCCLYSIRKKPYGNYWCQALLVQGEGDKPESFDIFSIKATNAMEVKRTWDSLKNSFK